MSVIKAAPAGGNWTSGGTWVGGVVPTAADDVQLDATSGNVSINSSAAVCRSLDCTGYTGVLSHVSAVTITIGDSVVGPSNVALKMVPGMTYSKNGTFVFASTAAAQQSIESGGQQLQAININGVGSSYKLVGTHNQAGSITVTNGALDFDNNNVTCSALSSSNSNVRSLSMGSGTITLTGTGTIIAFFTTTNLTLNVGTSKIVISDVSSTDKQLDFPPSIPLYDLEIIGGGTGRIRMINANGTVRNFIAAAPKTLQFGTGTTPKLTITGSISMSGSPGNLITLSSTTPGTTARIFKASGQIDLDYLSLQDIIATGGAAWYAGANSTDAGNNKGWAFYAKPAGFGNMMSSLQ